MKKYLLDTNIITYLEDTYSSFYESIKRRMALLADNDEVYISVLTFYEIEYGVALVKNTKYALLDLKTAADTNFNVLPLLKEGAYFFGQLKMLYREKTGISKAAIERHNIDFVLAASALAEEAVMISNDSIFEKIKEVYPGLQFENWTQP